MKLNDMPLPPLGARPARVLRWRDGQCSEHDDWVSDEVPVALEFNGISHAVMLATPADLEDFALGFGLSEGLLDSPADLYAWEESRSEAGLTVQLEVSARCFARLKERRRSLAGRTGCGLCGVDSLAQVLRPLPALPASPPIAAEAIRRALDAMDTHQSLGRVTGATHAAACFAPDGTLRLLREDVGRHNALDKLVGAMARAGVDAHGVFVAVTSRASVEMVQKACVAGVPLLAAISAPTHLAIDTARSAGLSLVGFARQGNFVVYAHPRGVAFGPEAR